MSDWKPTASAAVLRRRARIIQCIRSFFSERRVVEVTTPVITPRGVTDPNIESIGLEDHEAFLRTSPEYWHKRLLADNFGDLYELGPVFRAGESGRRHQSEFTLLEWYRVAWSWQDLAAEVTELLQACLGESSRHLSVQYRSWRDCFLDHLELDPLTASDETLASAAGDAPTDCTRDMLLDYLFATRIQTDFDPGTITVVYHYPASQAALARLHPQDPELAQRFEVFIGTLELANGYQELTDADEQKARFERDNRIRRKLGRAQMPVDEALLEALHAGLPECAGVALGIDRLVMAALGSDDIARVTAFPARLTD